MSPLDLLQLVVGVPAVLVLPGYVWSLAAFPAHRRMGAEPAGRALDAVERATLSLLLSLALVSLGALLWNGLLGLPLGFLGSSALVGVLSGAGLAVWRVRLARAPQGRR